MSHHTPPTLGAALFVAELAEYRDWLFASSRDLEIQDPFNVMLLDDDAAWRARAREAKQLLAGYPGRIGIHGPFEGMTIMTRDPKIQRLMSERLLQGLTFAAEVGATHMVVHSPWMSFGTPFVPFSPYYTLDAQLALSHAILEAPLKLATEIGCAMVIENIRDTNPHTWMALINSFNSKFVRASIDVGHAHIMHNVGAPPVDQWVREAGPMLEHVHLQDTDRQTDRHWAPGDGDINWFAVFEAIAGLKHAPRLILELHDKSRIPLAVEYLVGRGLAK